MKCYNYILVFLLVLLTSNFSFAQVKVYPGLVYGSEIEKPGFVLGSEFFLSEKVSISPDFIYYLPQKESQVVSTSKIEVKAQLWELNGNVHYYFVNNSSISFYGLGGLNYSHAAVKYKQTDTDTGQVESEFDVSDGEVGLNLGAGVNFAVRSSLTPFLELKYVAASTDQLVIGGGLKFDLN